MFEAENNSFLSNSLRKFNDIIDQLRDIGIESQVKLPKIAVLGTQSSGKSSLLESIVGLDFLPRGQGVVTRRPLELRLVRITKERSLIPFAIFEEDKTNEISNFEIVRSKIVEYTDAVAGKRQGIKDDPIILTIYTHTCPDLTIIDLPGITKIPLRDSDQNDEIEKVTKGMAIRYCSDPETIILCVIPSNMDLSTSESLKIARDLDPEGERTIGVLTKIDIMDFGTNCKSILMNTEIKLKLGYIGVKLRSQLDIDSGKKVKEALSEERKFFSSHLIYSTLPSTLLGAESLSLKLKNVFYSHMERFFPEIVEKIFDKIKRHEQRLKEIGPNIPIKENDKFRHLWELITVFCNEYKIALKDSYSPSELNFYLSSKKMKIPFRAQIMGIFEKLYADLDVCDFSDSQITEAQLIYHGESIASFQSMDAFLSLLEPSLKNLLEPAEKALEDVFNILLKAANRSLKKTTLRFPLIFEELFDVIKNYFDQEKELCYKVLVDRFEAETGYIFTNDETFLNSEMDIFFKKYEGKNKDKSFKLKEFRQKLELFYKIILRNLKDSVPKIIGYFMIKKSEFGILPFLQEYLMENNKKLQDSMSESQKIADERYQINEELKSLNKAKKIIHHDPELMGFYENRAWQRRSSIANSIVQAEIKKDNPPKFQPPAREKKQSITSEIFEKEETKINLPQKSDISKPSEVQSQVLFQKEIIAKDNNPKNNVIPNQNLTPVIKSNPIFEKEVQELGESNKTKGMTNNEKNKTTVDKVIDNATDKTVDMLWENDQFQKGMRDTGKKAAYNMISQKIPMAAGADGKHPLGSLGEKAAEKLFESEKVQNALKDSVKNATKTAIKSEVNGMDKKKGGFWGFN